MRSYDRSDDYDVKEAERLQAEQWQLDLLDLNPAYVFWGPHEDYMVKEGGWDSRAIIDDWASMGFSLDNLNEVVNFYFSVGRESAPCSVCGETGYHPDAQWVTESFYRHASPFAHGTPDEARARAVLNRFSGRSDSWQPGVMPGYGYPSEDVLKYGEDFREFCEEMRKHGFWSNRLDQHDLKALEEGGRDPQPDLGHDAINRSIMCEARLARYGIPTSCPECGGHGSVFTSDHAHVSLTLWVIHPRKGCSRGVEVSCVKREELPEIFAYLRRAAECNASRFSKIPVTP